jgi:hypothetical protein
MMCAAERDLIAEAQKRGILRGENKRKLRLRACAVKGLSILACCALASVASAETAAEHGKRVVDESLQALGGDAFLKMEDRVESGRAYSFYRSEVTGLAVAKIYTRYLPPDSPVAGKVHVYEREAFFSKVGKKEEDAAVVFKPDGGWELTYRGAVPVEDQRFKNYTDSTLRSIFYILRCRLKEPGLEFYWQGSDMYERRPVDIVDITDAANQSVTVYFDRWDKMPVRQVFKRRNPQLNDYDTEVTVYAKYRDIGGGVKWPLDIRRERNGDKIYEMYSDSVEINKNLTDDLFQIPVGMKVLPKPK